MREREEGDDFRSRERLFGLRHQRVGSVSRYVLLHEAVGRLHGGSERYEREAHGLVSPRDASEASQHALDLISFSRRVVPSGYEEHEAAQRQGHFALVQLRHGAAVGGLVYSKRRRAHQRTPFLPLAPVGPVELACTGAVALLERLLCRSQQ
eukprot:164659-Pleurochrysis_carterae.AAC.8